MDVRIVVGKGGDMAGAREWALKRLKERLWEEVWRDEIDLEGVELEERKLDDGSVEVIARVGER